ncbi:hypothetical protein T484DRAFT_2084485 [Baffinella frigidus]|nr:hypothetical protein T484DRAFT_2084485 [Cryptophyta sp. CCMP2293]
MRRGAGSTDPVRQDAKPTNEPRRKASRDGMPRSSMRGASRGAEDVPERPTLRTPLPSMGSSFGGERPPFPESQPGFMSLGSRGSSRGPQREGTAGSFKKGVSWGASFSSRVQSGDSVLDSRPETGLSLPFSPTGRRSSDTAPISQEVDELQSQLNLLRERSWSEQQSLRRQLDDAKAEGEGLRRETEGAQLQAQQYSNELTVLRERAGTAAQLAEGGDALQLIDEKNMQIRHLEGLVKDLASAAMPSMPGGGGLRAAPAGDGAASAREATLQEEVERLVMQRDKEQEDLKELEQVVVQFEGRMGALKRENKELKRAGGELRQRIAEQEERGHQNTHHSAMLPPQGQGAGGEDRLRVVVDRLSEQLRDARQQGGAVLSLLDHMHAWRRTTGGAARAPGGGAREVGGGDGGEGASDREAVLEQKLLRATERAVAAEERKDAEVAQLGNVLDAERAQGGRMAQRLMSAEEGLASATPELAALRGTVAGLERELEFSKRRVEAAEADAPEGDAAAERLRDLQRDNLSLEEDVMSLRALLSNTRARFTTSRVPALALVVRSRTAVALSAAFQAWVLHTVCQRRVEDASERGGQRLRSRALGATTFHAWREGTTLCTREELKAAEGRVTALEEEVKGAGESVARADAQARALEDQCAQLERAAGASGHTEHALRALEGEHAEVVAAGARRDALAREKQRLAQKQATGAMTASEAGAALLRERCTVLSSQLALAGREHAKMSGALRGVSQLRSSLDALLRHVYLCKASIPVAGISDAEPAEGDTVEACLMIADNLRRECEPLIEAAAAHDRYGGTIPALSAEEAERFQPFNASQIVAKDMALLKQRVVVSEAGAAAAREEAREARGALLREGEAREDEGASHAAQLALAQNEARFLQEIADGGDVRQVFHATVRHLETFVLQVVARLGKKSGECLVLERQARTLSKEALGSAQALEAARRDMQIPAAPAVPQVEGEQERWQQAMDYAAALSAEVKEVTALWRAATGEIFELQSSALQHSAALSAAEETARGAEARGKQVAGERAGLAQQLAGASAQLEQLQRAGEAARVRAEAAAEEAADAVKRRREADAGREEALARLGVHPQPRTPLSPQCEPCNPKP